MNFKKKKQYGKNQHYSVVNKLKKEEKITEEFEVMLNSLSLEEIVAIKLELASRTFGGKSYGLPIWKSMREIVQDAVLKYALSACRTKKEAARFLGMRHQDFNKIVKKYNTESFFEKEVKNLDN
jgi:hypothetical protein